MCYKPRVIRTSTGPQVCSCGKCLECKRVRQNDVAHRLWIAAKNSTSIHFWTLTYADEKLPLFIKASNEYLRMIDCGLDVTLPVREEKNLTPDMRVMSEIPVDARDRMYYDDEIGEFVPTYATASTKFKKYSTVFDRNGSIHLQTDPFYRAKEYHFDFGRDEDGSNLISHLTDVTDTVDFAGEFLNRDDKFQRIFVRRLVGKYHKFIKSQKNKNAPMEYGIYTITPSACSRDIQLWIKRFKGCDGHKRNFKFKYYLYPEYGPRTDRVHYHMLTFGLTDSECEQMRREWIKMFGNENSYRHNLTRFERKPLIDTNGDPAAAFVARYISKYISKGRYESFLVQNGHVKKPRALASTGLWSISEEEFRWYSGQDLLMDAVRDYVLSGAYAELDAETRSLYEKNGLWRFLPREYYTDEILSQIKSRLFYQLPNGNPEYKYSLGRSIKNKIFKYEKEVTEKKYYVAVTDSEFVRTYPRRILSTPLSLAMSDFIRKCHLEDFVRECSELRQDVPFISDLEVFSEIQRRRWSAFKDREQVSEKNVRKFLQKSLF